jgi:hypothetical protein
MPKLVFDTKAEWDQAVENVGIETADTGITLDSGATPLLLADDFEDGIRDPLWKGHVQDSLIAAFDPAYPSDEPLGCTNLRIKLAQSFTLPIQIQLSEIQLKLEEYVITTTSPDLIVEIHDDNGGEPSGNVLASRTIPYADLTPITGWTEFDFPDLPTLPAGQKLWIVFYTDPVGSSTEHINWLYDLNQDLSGQNLMFMNGSTLQWQTQYVPTHDFYFRISRGIPEVKPTESGGYLSFEYNVTSGSGEHIHVLRDLAQGDVEMEYRFRLRRLAANFNSGQFIFGMLQGSRSVVDGAERDAKLLHEFRLNVQDNFVINYEARMVDPGGTVHSSGSGNWPNINFQPGFIASDTQIFNLKVTRQGNGIKYLFYHSDNPANVLLETQVSPELRTLPGDIHADLGAVSLFNTLFGSAIDLDYVMLSSPPQQFQTGFVRLRHSFGVKTRLENFEIQRLLPVPGDKVELQFRSGSSIAELEAALFGSVVVTEPGSFNPGNPQNEFERAILSLASAEFFETKISLTAASPAPTLNTFFLEFTEEAAPAVIEEEAEPLALRRHIDSDSNWYRFIEKSSSIQIVNGMATLAAVFQDLFDGFSIGPEWTKYERNASLYESFGFLRMDIQANDSDALLVKTDPVPADINTTVRWKMDGLSNIPPGGTFLFNIFSIYNSASIPVPSDIRFGGLGTSTTHFTVIIRRTRFGDGVDRIGIVACRSDGVFVGWDEGAQSWNAGAQDLVIPAGKEDTLWSFEVSISGGSLTVIARDDQGVIRFNTSAQPLSIKIGDNQPYLVLGDSDLSDMPVQTTQLFDSIETDIPTTGATSGFIRFRDSLGAKGRLGKIKIIPSTQIQFDPAPVSIKARSADTVEDLVETSFKDSGQFIPNVNGNELELDIPPGAFIEVELNLFSASPGPEIILLTWDIDSFIEDNPLILSLDAISPDAVAVSAAVGTGQPEDQVTVPNVKDGDPKTKWISTTGQEGYGISWSLTLGFQKGAVPFEEVIDTIILRNTNFKEISITLTELNSNNPETVFTGEILTEDAIITFDPKLTAQIIISIATSQSPNENKFLGEIYAGRLLVALPGFDDYEPGRQLIESGNLRTLGGNLITFRGRNKYASRWRVSLVSRDVKDEIVEVFKDNPEVTFWPEPKTRPRDLFDVGWTIETLPFPYSDVFKEAGHTIEAEMTELRGE